MSQGKQRLEKVALSFKGGEKSTSEGVKDTWAGLGSGAGWRQQFQLCPGFCERPTVQG